MTTLDTATTTITQHHRSTAAVAVLAGLIVAAVSLVAGAGWLTIVVTVWAVPVAAAALIDATTTRLPNAIIVPGIAASVAATVVGAVGSGDSSILTGSAIGAGLFGGWLLVVHLVAPTGLGFGDVKYAVLLGVGIGAIAPVGVVLVVMLSVVVHAVVVATRPLPAQRTGRVEAGEAPYGPALAVAAVGFVIVVIGLRTGGGM